MPTAVRLVATIVMALTGALAAHFYVPVIHEDTILPYFLYLSAGLAAIVGWKSVGPRIESGKYGALSSGLTGTALFAFLFVFFQVFYRVIQFALWKRYRRNADAIDGFVDWMLEYTWLLLTPEVLAVLLCGGIAAGVLGTLAGKLWK